MTIAQLLTPMQVMLLQEAAARPLNERPKAIDEITALIKKQSPQKFFHYTDAGKPDPAMRNRVFHDEPRNLELSEYAGSNVPYAGINQSDIFKARNKKSLDK